MKIAIQTSVSPKNNYRGIGIYTSLIFDILKKGDLNNTYYYLEYNKDPQTNTDILIIPNFSFYQKTIPLRSSVKKTIVTVHDVIPLLYKSHFPAGIKGNVIWLYQKYLIQNKVDWIITDTNASKNDIKRHIPQIDHKLSVVYPVVSNKYRVIKNEEELNAVKIKYALNKPFVLYVGDVTWNKNLITLIESAKRGNYQLIIVGRVFTEKNIDYENKWNKPLKQILGSARQASNIRFLGYVNEDELVSLYNLATLYVQPSVYEGFGLPIVEAMKCATPIVISNIPVFQEVAGDAGVYFDPNNRNDLDKKILKAISDKGLREKMSQLSIERSSFFTQNRLVSSFKEIYEKINL